MKIIGIIPARYKSSRFPGKPLVDICGKPMIYWVYNQAKKVDELDEIYVVTSDLEIENCCLKYSIPCICKKQMKLQLPRRLLLKLIV